MDERQIASSAGSGIFGVILGYLGFRSKVASLEKSLDALRGSVRYVDTCDANHAAITKELKEIKEGQADMQRDLTKFHKNMGILLERTKGL